MLLQLVTPQHPTAHAHTPTLDLPIYRWAAAPLRMWGFVRFLFGVNDSFLLLVLGTAWDPYEGLGMVVVVGCW